MTDGKRWIFLLLMAVGLVTGLPLTEPPKAESKSAPFSKLAPDLIQQVRSQRGGSRASVVVQFNKVPPPQIDALLTNYGATVKRRFSRLNTRAMELPLNAVEALASRNEVRYISPDRQMTSCGHIENTTGTAAVRVQTSTELGAQTTDAAVFDGHGIGIAIVDSGIDVNHTAFKDQYGLSRVIVSRDFTGEDRTDDPYGHGTHVASIAAGNNQISNGLYTGIASNANLINLRILNSQGAGATSNLLAALDWILTYRATYDIRVVNMSVGTPAIDSYANDPLCQAVRLATDSGLVVVAAAGNNGKDIGGTRLYGQIHSPGNEPAAITVGAMNTFGTDERADDVVTSYSSRGPTRSFRTDENNVRHYDNLMKPDLIAPGNKIVGAASADNYLLTNHPELNANVSSDPTRRMMYLSGSSMATPIAAGTAALLLQANPNLTPSLVKMILMYTAQPLAGANTLEQGAGEINVEGAMRLAQAIRSDLVTSPVGAPLLTGSEPAQETTLNAQTFSWARGIILNHTYANGDELITRYQKVYGRGYILGDSVIESSSTQSIDAHKITASVLLGTNIVTSNGSLLGDGTVFLDLNFLLGDGLILSDGILGGDGVLVGDGVMVGDGILVGDVALSAVTGDDTSSMR